MSTLRCPICGKQFEPQVSAALPFCSDRCRQIDLGRWLREGYSVPVTRKPEDEEEVPPTDAPPNGDE
ncbi:MAG TPA: DNA gyrase inhibitor YacG [Pirellulaceae bacterium]|nr:DNA gyrase inhibitor YacG [Pirellulaceae bacterium]